MVRSLSRRLLPSLLFIPLLTLAACSEDEPFAGPSSSEGIVHYQPLVAGSGAVTVLEVIDLGVLNGEASHSLDLNDSEAVIGQVQNGCCRGFPFIWTEAAGMTSIAGLRVAEAINNDGFVAGSGGGFALVWKDDVTIALDQTSVEASFSFGINESAQIVGQIRDGPDLFAAVWTPNATFDTWGIERLVSVETDVGQANDINNIDQLVGFSNKLNAPPRATLWSSRPRTRKDLGTLVGGTASEALAINDNTHIVGWSLDAAGLQRPFLCVATAPGTPVMSDLGTLGGDEGIAHDMTNDGLVVGASEVSPGGPMHATLWLPSGEIVDLGGLPGFSESAVYAINANGSLAGSSVVNGQERATVWRLDFGSEPPPGGTTPGAIIAQLIADVDDLFQSGALKKGKAKSLTKKLEKANKKLERNQPGKAVKKLDQFIKQVTKLVDKGKLSAEDGQNLIDQAQAAIDLINNSTA